MRRRPRRFRGGVGAAVGAGAGWGRGGCGAGACWGRRWAARVGAPRGVKNTKARAILPRPQTPVNNIEAPQALHPRDQRVAQLREMGSPRVLNLPGLGRGAGSCGVYRAPR